MVTCGKLIMRTGIIDSISLGDAEQITVRQSQKQETADRKQETGSYLLRTWTGSTSKYGLRMSMLAYRLKALEA